MSELTYDIDRVSAAATKLLDPKWGNQRMRKIQEAVEQSSNQKVYFQGNQECLNELVKLGRQSLPALSAIFQLVLDKRGRLAPPSKKEQELKQRMRENTRATRELERMAITIERLTKGRILTKEEEAKALKTYRSAWKKRRLEIAEKLLGSNYVKTRTAAYDKANGIIKSELESKLKTIQINGVKR